MFSWFTKQSDRADADARAAVTIAIRLTSEFGAILEEKPGFVRDTAALPAPKERMKAALKLAWRVAQTDELRNALEISYVSLANFQDGIGSDPISLSLPETGDPSAIITNLERTLPWMDKTSDEMKTLLAEFDTFKRSSA